MSPNATLQVGANLPFIEEHPIDVLYPILTLTFLLIGACFGICCYFRERILGMNETSETVQYSEILENMSREEGSRQAIVHVEQGPRQAVQKEVLWLNSF